MQVWWTLDGEVRNCALDNVVYILATQEAGRQISSNSSQSPEVVVPIDLEVFACLRIPQDLTCTRTGPFLALIQVPLFHDVVT